MRALLTVALALADAWVWAQPHTQPGLWERLAPAPAVTAVCGNGRLTAGVDGAGRVVVLRWPSPGYHDQLESRPEVAAAGAFWSVRVADTVYWLDESGWEVVQRYAGDRSNVVVTRGLNEAGIRVTQELAVHPAQDVLAARIRVTGVDTPPGIAWHQHLAPCAHKLPGLPVGDTLLEGTNGFAITMHPFDNSFYSFRPRPADRAAWRWARHLAGETGMAGAWGEWMTPRAGVGVCAVLGAGPTEPEVAAALFTPHTVLTEPGRVDLELQPQARDGGWEAEVFLSLNVSWAEAEWPMRHAREAGFDALRRAADAHWAEWLDRAGLTLEDSADESARRRALLTVAQLTDRATGAVAADAARGLVDARSTAWAADLLDGAGLHAEAGAALRFLAEAVRLEAAGSAPAGTLPLALYTDGTAAAPAGVVYLDGVGWWLTACLRHARVLPDPAPFLEATAPAARAAGDFLAGWVLMPSGEPFPSYQTDKLRDGQSVTSLLLARLGLESAARLADLRSEPVPPAWTETLADFEARLRFRAINQAAPWVVDPLLPAWLGEILAEDDRLWATPVRRGDAVAALRDGIDPAPLAGDGQTAVDAALRYLAATVRIYAPAP